MFKSGTGSHAVEWIKGQYGKWIGPVTILLKHDLFIIRLTTLMDQPWLNGFVRDLGVITNQLAKPINVVYWTTILKLNDVTQHKKLFKKLK